VVLGRYPVAAIDRLAVVDASARVLAEYGWGGYVIYRLYDHGGRVFVDGRNDLYPQELLDQYTAARNADPGWQQILRRYDVQAILFKPDATLVKGPAQTAGWCETYRDEEQVLLQPCG
jgi:hypothetical protein